ncbi:probable serine/threonine-protein kinase At1g01540 isoform X2 [Hevea brasiliensis]|nr:probable serine/threonine-protein kinase At1g01540 isoform X2 [Hevea brasiliensis]
MSEVEMNIAKLDHHNPLVSPQASEMMITTQGSGDVDDLESDGRSCPLVLNVGRGNRFALRDMDVVTNGFADQNVIGNGDYGVAYRGILLDATRVAVKRLFNKSCQAKDFVAEVEVIGHVRHKNLVKLLGYCMEGGYRMLVNEYVDNGNLQRWLHGCPEQASPLTWGMRMNIIQGVAKGLAYLHEDIEPKIVHRNIKSSNILLDQHWNPKISDFGIVKLFGPEGNDIAARLMGKSGYLSPEYASNGVLDEKTDVYSFGILIMEIICGRTPVDHNHPHVYLIDWLKSMVANKKIMYVADPKLAEMPSSKELKRILLLALRCADPNIKHRPTMGDVIHMLEPRDLLLNDEHRIRRGSSSHRSCSQESRIVAKSGESDFNTCEKESNCNVYQKMI